MLPSTFSSRHLTLDFLPSTFYPRLFTLTLDFLPSPSTFYPRPRHLTLDTQPIDKLSNLITVNCPNYLNVHYQSLKFCVLNARSVRNKTADILDYICECKLDVVGITESWVSSDDAAV